MTCPQNMVRAMQDTYRLGAWRRFLELLCMLGDEASVHNALLEVLNVQDHGMVLNGGWYARDDQLIQSTPHAVDGSWPVLSPHNQLAQKGVIVWWHLQLFAVAQ